MATAPSSAAAGTLAPAAPKIAASSTSAPSPRRMASRAWGTTGPWITRRSAPPVIGDSSRRPFRRGRRAALGAQRQKVWRVHNAASAAWWSFPPSFVSVCLRAFALWISPGRPDPTSTATAFAWGFAPRPGGLNSVGQPPRRVSSFAWPIQFSPGWRNALELVLAGLVCRSIVAPFRTGMPTPETSAFP